MTAAVLALPATAPFDFDASVAFVCGFAPTRGEQGAGDGKLIVAMRAAGSTVLATVTAAADAPGVQVSLRADGPLGAEVSSAAAARIAFWLSLDDDLAPFYDIARDDVAFRPVLERLHGYHQVKFASPWENVAWAILAQRTPMPLAQRAKRALIEHVGNAIEADGRTWWAFPDAEQVAGLDPAALAEVVGNERKAGFLHESARRWTAFDEQLLGTAPHDEVRDLLLGLPGIGPWSASFVMIRGLGRMESVSADREMLRAATRVYGHPVDEAELARLAEPYGAWAGYWAHYLRASS
ncbi:DNA-3-methyladenine glycosylase [Cellulomonas sp. Root485]|uniref:DNA-3-methyladenine glycosylase family protein n=1 Tax=Cellulomonas sp. Root485 TaxID=1736546 RepID=UPI000A8112A9|nr:DNA-3-methyladenine glycosylase 2 family protein [Cellulomonas sp. Root485]